MKNTAIERNALSRINSRLDIVKKRSSKLEYGDEEMTDKAEYTRR